MQKQFFFLKPVTFVFFAAALFFAGCASQEKSPSLELENILAVKAQKKAELAAKAEKEEKEASAETEPAEAADVQAKKKLETLFKSSKSDPPELAFLELPEAFFRVSRAEMDSSEVQKFLEEKQIPRENLAALWRIKASAILIAAEKKRVDTARLARLSPQEFQGELARVGEEFNDFYRNTHRARASVRIYEKGPLRAMKVTSKFLEDQDWFSDTRLFYFYKPDYRLILLVSGKEDSLEEENRNLKKSLRKFEERLAQYFPQGISLQKA